ncbi:hypothetical protein [Duganella sp. S19_KUP01_CR8]|uniref:hypothetical protein n=1 Tax=Duganella sp. S19_KUP01_CR8 TaxID=3025502 RepID=UPI002FCD726C
MEYRFSLTPRLIALAIFSGVALLVLLFALGYQVGLSMAERPAPAVVDNAANRARQQVKGKITGDAAAAAAPATERVNAAQKAAQ